MKIPGAVTIRGASPSTIVARKLLLEDAIAEQKATVTYIWVYGCQEGRHRNRHATMIHRGGHSARMPLTTVSGHRVRPAGDLRRSVGDMWIPLGGEKTYTVTATDENGNISWPLHHVEYARRTRDDQRSRSRQVWHYRPGSRRGPLNAGRSDVVGLASIGMLDRQHRHGTFTILAPVERVAGRLRHHPHHRQRHGRLTPRSPSYFGDDPGTDTTGMDDELTAPSDRGRWLRRLEPASAWSSGLRARAPDRPDGCC